MMCSRFNVVAVALLAGIALVACGGSEATELAGQPVEAAGAEAATYAPADTAPPGDDSMWENEVSRLLDEEAVAFMTVIVEKDFEPLDGLVEQTQFMCERELELRSETSRALAALRDTPTRIEAVFAEYLDSRAASDAALAAGCEAIDANVEILETYARAGNTDFTGVSELDDAGRLTDAVRAQGLLCFELQELIAQESDAVLNCSGEAEPEGAVQMARPIDELRDDRDPTRGPTGGEAAGDFLLPAGTAEFDWFPVPFSIDYPEPLRISSGDDYIWIGPEDFNGQYLGLYAPSRLADPANPGSYALVDRKPVPESLEPWLAAMPIEVLERTTFETATGPGTRWLVSVERDAALELTSEPVVALWPATFGDLFMFGVSESETLDDDELEQLQDEVCFGGSQPDFYLWEMRASDGSLVVATDVFHNIFGVCEDVTWVEGLLATVTLP